jgi:hypothetical protein
MLRGANGSCAGAQPYGRVSLKWCSATSETPLLAQGSTFPASSNKLDVNDRYGRTGMVETYRSTSSKYPHHVHDKPRA